MSEIEHSVYEAFQYQPFDFVRKTHLEEDLHRKIGRLIREYAYNKERIALVRSEDACVFLTDACYFKSERNHLQVFTVDASYRCRDTLSSMLERYPRCLLQTDKQHLVNVWGIKKIQTDYILMKDGRKIPLSRRRKKYVEEQYVKLKESIKQKIN